MARFSGEVGYGFSVETSEDSGIWVDQIVGKDYRGDVLKNIRRPESGDELNKGISLGNYVSIVSDDYAVEHYSMIKYVKWDGVYWTVTSVEVLRPRLALYLGGVYNGPKA